MNCRIHQGGAKDECNTRDASFVSTTPFQLEVCFMSAEEERIDNLIIQFHKITSSVMSYKYVA